MAFLANIRIIFGADKEKMESKTLKKYIVLLGLLAASLVPFEILADSELKAKHFDALYGHIDRIYLNGKWKFQESQNVLEKVRGNIVMTSRKISIDDNDIGLQKGFYKREYDDSVWQLKTVPWSWNLPEPANIHKIPFAGIGYFRRNFSVPEKYKGMRTFLHFELVESDCVVWVNGNKVGTHRNAQRSSGAWWEWEDRLRLDAFSLDITDYIEFGKENVIALRVIDDGLPIKSGIWPDDGGITGPVYIDFKNPVHISRVLVNTKIRGSLLEFNVKFNNTTSKLFSKELFAKITPFESLRYQPPVKNATSYHLSLGKVKLNSGESNSFFSLKLKDPIFWDIETPFLYFMEIVDADGAKYGSCRFGFREFSVKGTKFYLNDNPIYVRGGNPDTGDWNYLSRTLVYNRDNWLFWGLKLIKSCNINVLRVHSGPASTSYYDLCDEIGIINFDDFSPNVKMLNLETVKNVEYIAGVDIQSWLTPDGKLIQTTRNLLLRWLYHLHNHPSVCTFSGGNELGPHKSTEKELADFMNNFYNLIKEHDLQKRPITASSGLVVWNWKTKVNTDYYDYHRYAAGDTGWADFVNDNYRFKAFFKKIFGRCDDKPMINGETAFLESAKALQKDMEPILKGGRLDRKAYVKWVNKKKQQEKVNNYLDFVLQAWYIRALGLRMTLTGEALINATSELYENYIRIYRRDLTFLEGVVLHSINPSRFGFDKVNSNLNEQDYEKLFEKALKNQEHKAIKKAYSPLIAVFDMVDRNYFAGQKVSSVFYVINQRYKKNASELKVNISLKVNEEVLAKTVIEIKDVPNFTRVHRKFTLNIPARIQTGSALLQLKLQEQGEELFTQTVPLYIMSHNDYRHKIHTNRTTFIFDDTGETVAIARRMGIKFSELKEINKIPADSTLIIGKDSLIKVSAKENIRIKNFIKSGGRVLCLEQNVNNTLALEFLPGVTLANVGNMTFADMIADNHPVLEPFKRNNFDLWNGNRIVNAPGNHDASSKSIYNTLIYPMSEGVVLSGAPRGGAWYRNVLFGMVAAEYKLGKGQAFISQTLAVARFNTDSVARMYLKKLFEYVLSENWDSRFTQEIK